jgi:hypothetical protein
VLLISVWHIYRQQQKARDDPDADKWCIESFGCTNEFKRAAQLQDIIIID